MSKDQQLWKHALNALECGEECMLLVVIESIGSSPGRAGFKALVTSGGALHGSIGGGSMEHKLVELARVKLGQTFAGSPEERRDAADLQLPFLKRQIHRADEPADRSGMICSGEQTIGFYRLETDHRTILDEIIQADASSNSGAIVFDQTGISFRAQTSEGSAEVRRDSAVSIRTDWCYTEQLHTRSRIIIFGAGHVGLALSRTMHHLGFHVHLMDDRADLNTLAANPWTHERSIVNYNSISELISDDPDLYVVLVSFGYRTDDILVRQLIRKKLKYLGMMGSAEKIKTQFAALRKDGFSEQEIARVRAPIGMMINSKTPEEIAVSIAAEIVGVKNS